MLVAVKLKLYVPSLNLELAVGLYETTPVVGSSDNSWISPVAHDQVTFASG